MTVAQRSHVVDIEQAVHRYLIDRDPTARYTSFHHCFNHFQQHRAVAAWGEPTGMEVSFLHLGFYRASWGMLRGSSDLLQRSARHLVPLVETVADAPAQIWDLDLDGYDREGINLVYRTALDIRRALRPVEASDILVTKVMLGVFGCAPAFDTYFKKGFGVSTFSQGSLRRVGAFYRANAATIDQLVSRRSTSQPDSPPHGSTPEPKSWTWSSSSKVDTREGQRRLVPTLGMASGRTECEAERGA